MNYYSPTTRQLRADDTADAILHQQRQAEAALQEWARRAIADLMRIEFPLAWPVTGHDREDLEIYLAACVSFRVDDVRQRELAWDAAKEREGV